MIFSAEDIIKFKNQIIKTGVKFFGTSTESFINTSVSERHSKYKVLAELSDCVVAGYMILMFSVDDAELIQIVVNEKFRGQGVGESLLKEAFLLCENQKKANIFLEVRLSNEYAIGLYSRCGFERIGIRKNYYNEPMEDAVIMKKEVIAQI